MELNRRETQRAVIVRSQAFVASENFERADLTGLRERKKWLKAAFDRYQEEHMAVVENVADEDGLEVQNEAAAIVEEIYLQTSTRFSARIDELQAEIDAQNRADGIQDDADMVQVNQVQMNRNRMPEIQLERIKLTNFSGEQADWSEWRAMFDCLVHNNEQLNETQKFHYLKKSIDGAAKSILKGWQVIGPNYQSAYEAIVLVFENKYRMTMAHLNELFKIPALQQESFAGLRNMIDTTNRVMRQLQVAGSPVESWDHVIVFALIVRMPPRTVSYWENSNDLKEMPKVKEVLDFLEKRARSQVNLNQTSAQGNNQKFEQKTVSVNHNMRLKPKPYQNDKANGITSNEQKQLSCNHCKLPHPMSRCSKFRDMSLDERRNRVRDLNLCMNCFSPNHRAGSLSCKANLCRCGRRHNSLLCGVHTVSAMPVGIGNASGRGARVTYQPPNGRNDNMAANNWSAMNNQNRAEDF